MFPVIFNQEMLSMASLVRPGQRPRRRRRGGGGGGGARLRGPSGPTWGWGKRGDYGLPERGNSGASLVVGGRRGEPARWIGRWIGAHGRRRRHRGRARETPQQRPRVSLPQEGQPLPTFSDATSPNTREPYHFRALLGIFQKRGTTK